MKKIPFSIEYFKANPGCKVVDRLDRPQRVFSVDHVGGQPIVASITQDSPEQNSAISFYDGGLVLDDGDQDKSDLFILTEPKLRAWKPEEVPVGALIRHREERTRFRSQVVAMHGEYLVTTAGVALTQEPLGLVFDKYEHSTDGGKTWKPCGVEE